MSDVRNYLLTVDRDKGEASVIARGAASKLESQQLTLLAIVQSLGEYIVDEDAILRSRAVTFLSQVIKALDPTFLSRQQIHVLCQFLCERIEDGGALDGLAKLQELERFTKDMAIMVLRAMLERFQDLQIRLQPQRLQILEFLNGLMSKHRSAIKSLHSESLVGIVDLVSGEKDPRNLMIVFSILKVIMVEWDIVDHAQNLFDAVFCYFPITFRPPPDDPYGITAQDLKSRLRGCIAATQYFAPYAFPQLIDKLDSSSPGVKKDVLQTITACVSSYDITTMTIYSTIFWDSLKYEILNVQEEDVAEEALVAIRAIAERLSNGPTSTDPQSPLATYMRPIMKECSEYLEAPLHKQSKAAGQILHSIGTASSLALVLVVRSVVPHLLALYWDANSTSKQRALLEALLEILKPTQIYYGVASNAKRPNPENPLQSFKDSLFEIFSQALMSTAKEEVSFRVVALKSLLLLCCLQAYLKENEVGMAVQYFDEIVLSENTLGTDGLRNAALQGLVDISMMKPAIILDITFPAFMATLPEIVPKDNNDYKFTLEALARISVERSTSDTLIRRLLSRLDIILLNSVPLSYPHAILSTLHYVFYQRSLTSDPNLGIYFDKIAGILSRAAIASTRVGLSMTLTETRTMELLGRLCCLTVRTLDTRKQRSVAQQVYTLFSDGVMFVPVPFRQNVSETQKRTMVLSTYLLAGVAKDVSLPYHYPASADLLNDLVRMSVFETSHVIRDSLLQQTALLVNKFTPNNCLHYVTDILWSSIIGLLQTNNLSTNSIRAVFWIAKGLILKLADTDELLHRLLALLNSKIHGNTAARGFVLLLAPDEIVSKENGAVIRILANQKVFNICMPEIAKAFKKSDTTVKSNLLIALSGILRFIAPEVLLPELETLLPLLLQSLYLDDSDVKAASIETITMICHENPIAVQGHIFNLVSQLLKCAADPKSNTPKARYSATRCLRSLPGKLEKRTLLPFRVAVTKGILIVLDDSKRHVRKEAVECRSSWLSLDETDDDDD
ncbi:hypothetical protein MMC26_007714 [Xylographa opegraphella]|nr:hypothetical protein [Xylographa opegraphella]